MGLRRLFSQVFGGKKAESVSRLGRVVAEDVAAREVGHARRLGEQKTQADTNRERLDRLLLGEQEARRKADARRDAEAGIEEIAPLQPLGEKPSGGARWIPAASSLVDAFRWTAYADNPNLGRLWIRFTNKSSGSGKEGYYNECSIGQYDDFFMAPSKGEWIWDQFIHAGVRFHATGRGPLIGTILPWPRRGSRGGDKTPGSWYSRTGREERANRRR